ncbi:MAG: hypothetical protein ACPGUY_06500, partial [Akkermansiaceae bacterium]
KVSDDRVGGLYRRAIQDYRAAIQSDDATMDLYIKCYEKVRYTDQKRKASEFRDWKRKNKDRLNSGSMRMALRHQLSWLLLSIEAARREGDTSELGARAMKHLDQIFENAARLKDHRQILAQNALGSVFAKAYNLHIKVEKWPKSALDITGIYEQVVMPPLRKPSKISTLRSAWNKRILHEGWKIEKWTTTEGTTIGKKDAMRPPAMEKFITETQPKMQWDMEKDCFKSGDERVSALRMLKHIEKHMSHKDCPGWIKEFQSIINPKPAIEGAPSATATP